MSVYEEKMPQVRVTNPQKTSLIYQGVIISHYHKKQTNQFFSSPFTAKVTEVYFESGQNINVGEKLIKFDIKSLKKQLEGVNYQIKNGEGNLEKLIYKQRLLEITIDNNGVFPAQAVWSDVIPCVISGEILKEGAPVLWGNTSADNSYLAWDMSANEAAFFEKGTPISGVKLMIREGNKEIEKEFDLKITQKIYEESRNRYIYQIDLPDKVEYSIIDGSIVTFFARSKSKNEHAGVVPFSAVTFEGEKATYYVLRERSRIWGIEYFAEEVHAVVEEKTNEQVALTYFPEGAKVIFETDKPLQDGMAVRIQ